MSPGLTPGADVGRREAGEHICRPNARAIGLLELRALEAAAGEHVSRPDKTALTCYRRSGAEGPTHGDFCRNDQASALLSRRTV